MDTIFALATTRGKSGVAVIRVSGPDATGAARALAGTLPPARKAGLRNLRDSAGEVIDQALVLVFESGASFTGEPSVEFQTHGSPAVVNAVLRRLSMMPGLRMAEPGEFTRRALENERLDLARVEGLSDLIEAETELQRKQAIRLFSGQLGQKADRWRETLIEAAALLMASIDFSDEEVPEDTGDQVLPRIRDVRAALEHEISGSSAAERIRDGFEVAIVGPPNAGKSTLLNAIAGRDVAITSEVAGTTRDVIEVRLDLRGIPVTMLDTAGLREGQDMIEVMGVQRAVDRAKAADLRVFLVESGDGYEGLRPESDDIVTQSKSDLGLGRTGVSGKTGEGIGALMEEIADILGNRASMASAASHLRHRTAMAIAQEELCRAEQEVLGGQMRTELAAEHLRGAMSALDSLVGRIDVEDILDEVFARFCLGK